jgi:hypothetical protein
MREKRNACRILVGKLLTERIAVLLCIQEVLGSKLTLLTERIAVLLCIQEVLGSKLGLLTERIAVLLCILEVLGSKLGLLTADRCPALYSGGPRVEARPAD